MKIRFDTIGSYKSISIEDKKYLRIELNFDLSKALTKLELFSHCIIITRKSKLNYYEMAIKEVDVNHGVLVLEHRDVVGDIVDIKPFFPCEDRVLEAEINQDKGILINYDNRMCGNYIVIGGKGYIDVNTSGAEESEFYISALKKVNKGDYLRLFWWFDRFDKEEYRRNRLCKPPYENAPRCGIYATRSPVRPNPIATTVVKVEDVNINSRLIEIAGFDGFENSKILQIMDYSTQISASNYQVPSWVDHWTNHKVFSSSTFISTKEEVIDIDDVFYPELEEVKYCYDDLNSNKIVIEKASVNNLKSISLSIPRNEITVLTGISGSGKSSLAFDTIYKESKKQFADLVSSQEAMQDVGDSKVKRITGLLPAVAIEQSSIASNPRSTVGTISGVERLLRLLFSTIGQRQCKCCGEIIPSDNVCKKCGTIYLKMTPALFSANNPEYMCITCKGLGIERVVDPNRIVTNSKKSILDSASPWWGNLRKHRKKPNANWMRGEVLALANYMGIDLEKTYDELDNEFKRQLLYGSDGKTVTLSYENSSGRKGEITRPVEGAVNTINRLLRDNSSEKSISSLERYIKKNKCSVCDGEKLSEDGRLVSIMGDRYPQVLGLEISRISKWCHYVYGRLGNEHKRVTKEIFIGIIKKIRMLQQVGLGYLSLDRGIDILSGGENQRLKLARHISSQLSDVLYIMDEPSKGLHPKDFKYLVDSILDIKENNNTVILVEHNRSFMDISDNIVELGPGSGKYGGEIVNEIKQNVPKLKRTYNLKIEKLEDLDLDSKSEFMEIKGIKTNNLKDIDIRIPLKNITCVLGVSGSGKSTLVADTIYPVVLNELGRKYSSNHEYSDISGVEQIKGVYIVNQQAIGKNSRSNPGTYTGVLDLIRTFYASLEYSKLNNLTKEMFSFNSAKGQCTNCKGLGEIKLDMAFMEDISINCPVCMGNRYKKEVLEARYEGYSINDILNLEVKEVRELFRNQIKIFDILDMLCKVGLDYIKLGQSAKTLSGGEAQRVKLAKELSMGKTKDMLYILDEPSNGLHDKDIEKLMNILSELMLLGATIVVIEHNPSVIKRCNWFIELGPVGGSQGGHLLDSGWVQTVIS